MSKEPEKKPKNQVENNQATPEIEGKENKAIRRIAQRQEMPTDKAQLIDYLSNRIKQAQEALIDTQQLLETQVAESDKISKSIAERNEQLQKLYQVDQRALPEKIKQKLTQILTQTVNQKIEAEEQLTKQKNRNYEYKTMYDELKWQGINLEAKLQAQNTKQTELEQQLKNLAQKAAQHEAEITELTAEFEQLKTNKQSIQNKYLQMKMALDRMQDIRAVLNRFFGNEDLFDANMDLKQQKVVRPIVPPPNLHDQNRLPSRESKFSSQQPKLKPINRQTTKNQDEDFWRGDFSRSRPSFG